MKKKRRISLSTQINLIFTIITLITSVLFILIFKQTIRSFSLSRAEDNFKIYHNYLAQSFSETDETQYSQYYSYAIYEKSSNTIIRKNYLPYADDDLIVLFLANYIQTGNLEFNKFRFLVTETDNYYIITVGDGSYGKMLEEPVGGIILTGFISIIILGNAIILLWSSITVERIKGLQLEVSKLVQTSYHSPIEIQGNDEITELATTIDEMREEILRNDEVKQEMLQNLSHDIKTPIAVIKSYSEAIRDGITDPDDINIILRQTDLLSDKVKKLLEWNRLEYIDEKGTFYPVDINKIVNTVANNFKYKADATFELNLDNSYLVGLEEHYYTLVSNIVENAIRYAKTVIRITLKDQKLTIYNDGEHINEKFLNQEFKPYETGYKGQFGLGLTIVQKIIANFNLKLTIKNCNPGVAFIIEPLD